MRLSESDLRCLFEVGYETAKEFKHEIMYFVFGYHYGVAVVCIRATGNAVRVRK